MMVGDLIVEAHRRGMTTPTMLFYTWLVTIQGYHLPGRLAPFSPLCIVTLALSTYITIQPLPELVGGDGKLRYFFSNNQSSCRAPVV